MFAVIKTGGKQYKVAKDDVLKVEKLPVEAGQQVTFDQVLMIGGEGAPVVGAPTVEGASVIAEVVEQTRGPKIIIFKKSRRKHYRRKNGHRQDLSLVKIVEIAAQGQAKPAKKAAAKKADKADAAAAGETAAQSQE
jgi:large subunit ribosomal protein L21